MKKRKGGKVIKMIQNIINGMIHAIREKYDETYSIYTETVEQDLQKSCFFIMCLNSTDEEKAGTRHCRTYPCIINYFPTSEDKAMQECLSVMDDLYQLLKIINTDIKKFRSKEMKAEIEEGVLKFQVTYSGFILAKKEEPLMEALEVDNLGEKNFGKGKSD